MEHSLQPSESTEVGLQTDDDIQEVAGHDNSEDAVSNAPSLKDEDVFEGQEQNINVESEVVQSMDQQLHTTNEDSMDMPEDLLTSQVMVDEAPGSDMVAAVQQEAHPSPPDGVIDPMLMAQQHIGDQTSSELTTDPPEAEQMPTQEDHMQILNDTKVEKNEVSKREEEEKDLLEKEASSDLSSPTATGSLFECSLALCQSV